MAEHGEQRRRVLICEDDFLVAFTLRENLRHHGYDVLPIARDGAAAVALSREHRPDVVLMDLRMPTMNGVEATRAILKESPTCVILISAAPLAELESALARSGAARYLRKPILAADLVSTIEEACRPGRAPAPPPRCCCCCSP